MESVGTEQLVATAAADLEVVVENLLLAAAVVAAAVASVESFAESLVPEIDKSISSGTVFNSLGDHVRNLPGSNQILCCIILTVYIEI